MNYLAHLLLSHPDPLLMTGNFIADSVKGDDYKNYETGISQGIIMHRAIDDFTDHHPIVLSLKKIFSGSYDKYSGVLIDVYFDHILANDFSRHSEIQLHDFANDTYDLLGRFNYLFPEGSARFFKYMTKENILFHYSHINGIEKVLKGLTYRIKNRMQLHESIDLYTANEEEIRLAFLEFFNEIKNYIEPYRYYSSTENGSGQNK